MKKFTAFFLILPLLFTLAGCGELREQDPYRTDTVIYIPAEPTETKPEPVTEAEPETTEAPESESTGETIPEATKAASTKKPSSGSDKKPGSGSSKKPSSSAEPTTAPTAAPTEAPTIEPITEATTEVTVEVTEPPVYDISGYVAGSLETAMMNEINRCRAAEGLGELSKSSRLCAIASARAYEICQSWSHTRPDGRGYATVFGDYGYGCSTSAENLIYTSGGEDAATLVSKWMGADGTRNNLLSTGFTTVGIGIYKANGYVYIACLLTG